MPLTALDIYKLLPKTNCGKCGSPTCLAFAMRLAQKKAALDECPDVSEEAKAALEGASAPPIRLVTIGTGENKIEIGNETVMCRHEETFYHQPGVAITLSDQLNPEELNQKINQINNLSFERIAQILKVNLIAIKNDSNDPAKFAQVVQTATDNSQLPLILISSNPQTLDQALKICAAKKPLIYAANPANYQEFTRLAKQYNCPLAITASNLEELAELTPKITTAGVEDLILHLAAKDIHTNLINLTQIRRLALKRTFRPFGYPAMTFCDSTNPYREAIQASTYIPKYAGLVVLSGMDPAEILPLMVLRQNIYTDPRVPIQVEPKVYEIGSPNENSPVFVTTNFSLTYFIVAADIEACKIPSYLMIIDTEGQSVMTAWAAEKFTAEKIAEAIQQWGMEDKVKHRKIIIPGGVAVFSAKLNELTGWQVIVGPRESAGIPAFMKTTWVS